MKFCLQLIILTVINQFAYQAFGQNNKLNLNATILSQKDSTPIGFVHIVNLTSKHGVVSDYNGHFEFEVAEYDTLRFSEIGFESLKICAKNVSSKIYLAPKNYDLDVFTVLPYKDFEEFKEAFTTLVLPDTSLKMNPSLLMYSSDLFLYRGTGGFGIVVTGPITALYDAFSKKAKSKQRYIELLEQDRFKNYLTTKFNEKIVAQSTQLVEEKEIAKVMKYCDFTDRFITNANNYEIVLQIQHCYAEYLAVK